MTHFHWDHILGFPFFKPAYRNDVRIDVYGRAPEGLTLQSCLEDILVHPHFPIPSSALTAEIQYHSLDLSPFDINGTVITPVPLNHPNGGLGYKIEDRGHRFVFLTDNELNHAHPGGLHFQDYADFACDAELLIHDAEYLTDEYMKGWGHSTVDDAVRLAVEAHAGQLGLFHHHPDRTDDELDRLIHNAESQIQSGRLSCFGMREGMEIKIERER